jgi:DNA-binding MarR family transcriptional regulator
MDIPADLPPPSTERLRLVLGANLGLLAIADRLRQRWAAHAAAVGLSVSQLQVLLTLKPGEAIPMRTLAARLDYDPSNLSTLVDRLERRDAVERRPDPADRRVKALVLTEEGVRLRASFWHDLTEDPGPLAPLAEPELRTLTSLLGALAAEAAGGAAGARASRLPAARMTRVLGVDKVRILGIGLDELRHEAAVVAQLQAPGPDIVQRRLGQRGRDTASAEVRLDDRVHEHHPRPVVLVDDRADHVAADQCFVATRFSVVPDRYLRGLRDHVLPVHLVCPRSCAHTGGSYLGR